MPIALANAMCSSIVPMLTQLMVREEYGRAREKIGQAMRFTMIVALPSAVGLAAVLARPIVSMLFKEKSIWRSACFISVLYHVVFYTMSTLTNGVLQGINKMQIPVRNAAISLVIHIALLYAMLEMNMGINAVVYAYILFAVVVCVLNAVAIRKYMRRYKQEVARTFYHSGDCIGGDGRRCALAAQVAARQTCGQCSDCICRHQCRRGGILLWC